MTTRGEQGEPKFNTLGSGHRPATIGHHSKLQSCTANPTLPKRAGELTFGRITLLGKRAKEGGAMRAQYFRGNVFVANLPPEFSDDQLAEAFDSFGIVLSATIARDPVSGKRLRYGFVDIATERAAKLAIESMNGAAIHGYNLEVKMSDRSTAKKLPRPAPRPQSSVHRIAAAVRRSDDGEEGTETFKLRPQPRRQPGFQVERRSLPRRPPT